jgi:hypothetical protein
MTRKTLNVKITDAGRDQGKVFVITEMSARRGHQWATRALFGLMNTGIDLPSNVLSAGFAGLANIGIKALGNLPIAAAGPLMDELLTCVQIMPDPAKPNVVRGLIDDDTEEVITIFKLQKEVLALHTDFFTTAAKSISGPATVMEAAA